VLPSVGIGAGPQTFKFIIIYNISHLIGNKIIWVGMSDRTNGPWGRRNPWILGGLLTTAAAALMALALTEGRLLLCAAAVQVGLNGLLVVTSVVIPDRVPQARFATAIEFVGVDQLLGLALGSVIGSAFLARPGEGLAWLGLVPAAGAVTFVVIAPDQPAYPRTEASRRFLSAVLPPANGPDFYWAAAARSLNVANNLGSILAPGIATAALSTVGGYVTLFILSPALCSGSATLIAPIGLRRAAVARAAVRSRWVQLRKAITDAFSRWLRWSSDSFSFKRHGWRAGRSVAEVEQAMTHVDRLSLVKGNPWRSLLWSVDVSYRGSRGTRGLSTSKPDGLTPWASMKCLKSIFPSPLKKCPRL
jgi:hypothetical protein